MKKLQKDFAAAFIKIIKITQNWKVIGYFNDQKGMENAVELSLKDNDREKVWMVRNFKTVYRNIKGTEG